MGMSSKTYIIRTLMVFIIPFFAFMIGYNLYINQVMKSKIAQSNSNNLAMYQSYLEDDLQRVDYFLSNMIANDKSFQSLNFPLSDINAHLLTYDIRQKFIDLLDTMHYISGLSIYTKENNLYRSSFKPEVPAIHQEEMQVYLSALLEEEDPPLGSWLLYETDSTNYLLRILGTTKTFTICTLDLDWISRIDEPAVRDETTYLLYAKDANALSCLSFTESEKIRLKEGNEVYYTAGTRQQYFTVQSHSDYLELDLVYLTPYRGLLRMESSQIILIFATVLFLFLALYSYHQLRRHFFHPLNHLVATMESIKEGDLEKQMNVPGSIQEFALVNHTFNEMIHQVKYFQALAYDRLLEMQDVKLQYLQIQIRPHFFLNCLKNLYGMAQSKQFEQIQEMILALSGYFRSIIRESVMTAPLSRELAGVESYIRLQQLSDKIPPSLTTNIDPDLSAFPLPPLSILTFVENALKHGKVSGQPLSIHVKAALLTDENGRYLNLTILDNGPGYSAQVLNILNDPAQHLEDSHIGIHNVQQRFSMIYGNKSMFLFSNMQGACVDIFIPIEEEFKS